MHSVCMLQSFIANLSKYVSAVPCTNLLMVSKEVVLTGE